MFCMILVISSDKTAERIDLCNEDSLRFLEIRDWNFKYYIHEAPVFIFMVVVFRTIGHRVYGPMSSNEILSERQAQQTLQHPKLILLSHAERKDTAQFHFFAA